ncbi:MAG TPA: tRNA uridine-5-carboxymethylaminomethyl(34) synthesis GTPase MnmE [Syntrophobacteraceae bacterium]|nr:tRNA uridine-5-carboxymethylaminomethyl(34) synthesis GTPase MnmE [Syntrophobacteraceae bacterium]
MGPEAPDDTICAVATPVGEGGIGILKISGAGAFQVLQRLFRPHKSVGTLQSHRLHHGWIHDPESGQAVDEVLVSYMAAPHTYTREDVVEINCHSGYWVLDHILQLVLKSGVRLAEPGEFTRRAFLHGRIDLSQAEAVIEVIRSKSHHHLLMANRSLRGGCRTRVQSWRESLLELQARLEASIDFSDDLEEGEASGWEAWAESLEQDLCRPLTRYLEEYESTRVLREGLTLVLVGKPNVGKSSLLNVLLGKDRAIVTPLPGTTRDVIEDTFLLSGILVRILDTAGIRREPDEIESLGIERTLRSVDEADIALWLIDRSSSLTPEDDAVFEALSGIPFMILLNKSDLSPHLSPEDVRKRYGGSPLIMPLSVLNPRDIERLRETLADRYLSRPLDTRRSEFIPNLRQKECLEGALRALRETQKLLASGKDTELACLELDSARRQLDAILGREPDDELLDRIFSQFCIGK